MLDQGHVDRPRLTAATARVNVQWADRRPHDLADDRNSLTSGRARSRRRGRATLHRPATWLARSAAAAISAWAHGVSRAYQKATPSGSDPATKSITLSGSLLRATVRELDVRTASTVHGIATSVADASTAARPAPACRRAAPHRRPPRRPPLPPGRRRRTTLATAKRRLERMAQFSPSDPHPRASPSTLRLGARTCRGGRVVRGASAPGWRQRGEHQGTCAMTSGTVRPTSR